MDANEKKVVTPVNWSTTSQFAAMQDALSELDNGQESANDQTPGFEILLMIITILIAVLLIKRKR